MRKHSIAAALLLSLLVSIQAFSQGGFAVVTGSVSDTTGALIPGVMITAKAVDTGVVSTTISNDTGAYNFPSLTPGKYTLSASLTGLTTQTITDAVLGASQSYRYNFKMTVGGTATTQDVVISAQTMLATSGATIGQALSESKVHDLPLVGNNVLNLLSTLSGVEGLVGTNGALGQNNAFGREGTTLAGVGAQNIPTVRDGVIVSDTRYPTGINSATVINPDLVGEVRLILAPVDAELGRGNGTIQITTRSGTNKYTGSAVWTIRNSALNPNSWTNNSNRTLPPGTLAGTTPSALPVNWGNENQGTASFGGPIVKNKTFFFVLFDMNQALQRSSTNFTVLTPCARMGIFRYFDGWNAGNALQVQSNVAGSQTIASVNLDGTPKTDTITAKPDGTASTLQYRSIFGPLASNPTTNDCSGAPISTSTLRPNGTAATWDSNRVALDTTGFISRNTAFMPLPNNYEIGDGLNTAGFRWLRHNTGLDNLFSVGEDTGIRKQINVKIDQNFNAKNKANVNVSYERVHSDDVYQGWPGTFSNKNFHRPLVITSAFTSTVSASILNEFRFGYKETGTNVVAPWFRTDDNYQEQINAYLPPNVNGVRILARAGGPLGFCYPITGARPPGTCTANQALTAYAIDKSPTYTIGDTLSWTLGNHAMKFGYELRENDSTGQVNTFPFFSNFGTEVQTIGGSAPGAPQAVAGGQGINNSNPAFATLLNGTAGTARNLLDYMAGSVNSINETYWLQNPTDKTFANFTNSDRIVTPLHQTEMSTFAKDDYKITKHLTLNLGVRWEYYAVPYHKRGITVSPVGGSDATFGISGRGFANFWQTPVVGPGAATAFDPTLATTEQFVGPSSPNSGTPLYKNDWNNFGPSIGFSWQVPWFGEGKTTLRGGYQITYQGGGRFSTLEPVIAFPPGSTNSTTFADPNNLYLDMTDVANPAVIPVAPTNVPMGTIRVTDRTQALSVVDTNYVSPYVQNLTMALSRQVSRNLTLTTTYIGTLAVKQYSTFGQFNSANFLYNGLASEFASIRSGGESPLLDSMMKGINLCVPTSVGGTNPCGTPPAGSPAFGRIGIDPGQTAAQQMRSSPTFQSALALGNWAGLAGTLNTLNYVKSGSTALGTCTNGNAGNCTLPDLPSGISAVTGAVMRNSGLFPENFIVNNPQYGGISYLTNQGHSNYHSVQIEGTYRPIQGITVQGTYTFAKNLGLPTGTYTNPVDQHKDYTIVNGNRPQTLRTNMVFELPIGPNKLMFGNTSGAVARVIERWQVGVIYNYNTGSYMSMPAQNGLYALGTPDIVATPFTAAAMQALRDGNVTWSTRNTSSTGLEGRYFGDQFASVTDPVCATVTSLQGLNGAGRCTLRALAYIVPDGTPGSIPVTDTIAVQNPAFPNDPSNTVNATRTRSGVIVLQNPLPGTRGSMGQNTLRAIGSYALDANISKQFRLTESKSIQIRIDTTNVLNHPTPGGPNLTYNSSAFGAAPPFGQITSKSGGRAFQGQLRFSF